MIRKKEANKKKGSKKYQNSINSSTQFWMRI